MTNAEMFQDVFGRYPYLPCEDGYYIDAKLQDRQWWDMPFRRDISTSASIPSYDELLKAARAMHTWIFLYSRDEKMAYEMCGLSDEMNAFLGYDSGSFIIPIHDGWEE